MNILDQRHGGNSVLLTVLSFLLLSLSANAEVSDTIRTTDSSGIEIQQLQTSTVRVIQSETDRALQGKALFQQSGETLARSLEFEKQFARRSMGPAPARPVFRGLGGDHIQIAQNGNEVTDLSGTSPDHAVGFSQSHLRSIHILEGADLLPYSLSLVGARIDGDRGLFLSEPEERFNMRWNSLIRNFPRGGLSALQLEIPVSSVTARLQTSGAAFGNASAPGGILENTDSHQWDMAGGVQLDLQRHRFGGNIQHFSLEYGVPGGFVGAHRDGVRIQMTRNSAEVGHVFHSGDDSVRTIIRMNRFSQIETEVNGPVGAEFLVHEIDFHTDWNRAFNNQVLHLGASGGLEDRQYGGFVYTPYTQRYKGAVWVKSQLSNFEFGGRLEAAQDHLSGFYARRGGDLLNERKFLAHALYVGAHKEKKHWNFSGALFQASRIPTVEELYSQGPHLAAWSYDLGNENIPRELGYGAKTDGEWQWKGFLLSADLFSVWYSDYIQVRPTGKTNWATVLPEYQVQAGSAILAGTSAALRSPPWKGFSVSGQWDYSYGQDMEISEPLPAISPARWQNSLSWEYSEHEMRVRSVYYFAQNRTSRFEQSNPSNMVFHADYTWQKAVSKFFMRAQLGVENIFNQEYTNHLSRIKSIFPEPGRSFYGKLLVLY